MASFSFPPSSSSAVPPMSLHSPPPNIAHQPHPSGTSDGNYPSLSDSLLKELKDSVQGEVFARIDAEFRSRTTIFNGNVVTPAKAVVIPANVLDVSILLKFCTKHGLYPSIKAGGYGTAGWAINGDIVVDLTRLNDIHIEEPLPDAGSGSGTAGGFRSLRDTPIQNMKGKAKLSEDETGLSEGSLANPAPDAQSTIVNATSAKRRRSADGLFDESSRGLGDLPRDPLVARFLHLGNDIPSPSIRRRLELDSESNTFTSRVSTSESMSRQSSSESGKSNRVLSNDGSSSLSPSTALTSTTPSTVPTSPDVQGDEADEDKKREGVTASNALDVIASTSAGLYDQRGTASHLSQHAGQVDPLETPTPTSSTPASITSSPLPPPASRTPSFSVRSEDPFGYLSAAPGVSSSASSFTAVRPARGYEQPAFRSAAGSSVPVTGVGSSSTPVSMLVDASVERSPFLESSPRPSFLSAPSNPVHPHAFVSFGAGVKQKDIDIFTALHPLPATSANGSVSSVPYHIPLAAHPVGSSVMLLGGFGFLSRLHGLSIDALVEVEMVLADGTIVFVSEKEHPDLWWALRGAGPAFGVVTRYKAKAYPVPVVFAGNLIYNFHASTAASLIKHFRDCVKSAPRELYANVLLTAGPADKGSLVVVQLCYVGAKEKGKEFLHAIASWDGEPCLLNEVCEKSFLSQQDSVAQILRGKAGRQWFIRSALITSLPDEIIHKTVNEFADTPVGCTWLFELAGGAVGDADDTCLPKSQREAGFTIAAFHQWEIDDDDPLCVTTAEHWIEKTLSSVSIGGPYPAFLGRHESAARIIGSYASNWSRLSLLKRTYDPHALFRHNFWPLDAEGAIIEPCTKEPKSPIMHPRALSPPS